MAETRWEQARAMERAGGQSGYGAHFARLMAEGVDVEGEARLADALAPREAWILDAGSGMGRVGAALTRRGHHVVGVDFDAEVIDQSRNTFPELPVITSRLDQLTPSTLATAGFPTSYDLIVCVGNVMVLLAPEGRMMVGFALSGAPARTARTYPAAEFVDDAASVGLAVESRHASYDLLPFTDASTYAVHVLRHA